MVQVEARGESVSAPRAPSTSSMPPNPVESHPEVETMAKLGSFTLDFQGSMDRAIHIASLKEKRAAAQAMITFHQKGLAHWMGIASRCSGALSLANAEE